MHAGGVLGRFIRPGAGTHVDLALDVRTFFHRKERGMNVPDQDGGFEELYFFSRGDGPLNFPTADQRRCVNRPLDDCVFSDYEDACGVDLPFEATIHSDRSLKLDRAFKADVFAEDREVLRVNPGAISRCILPPHNKRSSLPLEAPRPSLPRVKSNFGTDDVREQYLCLRPT